MTSAPRLLHHELSGPPGAPLLLLAPSLGTSMTVWEPQLAVLERDFRVLRFDWPGHGGSPTGLLRDPGPGRTTVPDLAHLVLDLVDEQGRDAFHYAGISLGGAVGMELALRHPARLATLGLVCTSAHFGAAGPWRERAALVRADGLAPLVKTSPGRWFADPAAAARTPLGRALLGNLAAADPAGYAACCDALAAYDVRAGLHLVRTPTVVVGGVHDVATPLEHARELADGIPTAVLRTAGCGHLAVEEPQAVAHAIMAGHPTEGDRPTSPRGEKTVRAG